jgi:hypothetical protein
MSRRRARILFAAVMSSVLAGLAVADSSSATTPDTVTESSESASDTVVGSSVPATTEGAAVEIRPRDELWAGVTRAEWEARSWQWSVSMPKAVNPSFDATGDRCGYGQFGPVFFLPGVYFDNVREFTCVVAEGTAIYANTFGTECSTVEPPPFFGRTESELRECASASLEDFSGISARINGQDVADLESYRIGSPLFTLTFPEDNIFGLEPGVAQSVSESYGFIIAPPPPGEYDIVFSTTDPGLPDVVATYNVIVEAPQVFEAPTTT